MTFWGVLEDGTQMLLGEPTEAVLSFEDDAPADQLKAVFPADKLWESMKEVIVYKDGKILFRGIVDEQNTTLSSTGLFVELVCRSMEAVLLDNEAEPMIINTPSLPLITRKLLEPLGFPETVGEESAVSGQVNVKKGTSCWTVLADFCKTHFGTVPRVDEKGVIHCEGDIPETAEIDEIISAEISQLRCKKISAVWQQCYGGGYDVCFKNPEAAGERRRYLSMQSGKDPREVIAGAEEESFLLTVNCHGAYWLKRGSRVNVTIPKVGRFENCPIREIICCRDKNGERTRLILKKGEFICG